MQQTETHRKNRVSGIPEVLEEMEDEDDSGDENLLVRNRLESGSLGTPSGSRIERQKTEALPKTIANDLANKLIHTLDTRPKSNSTYTSGVKAGACK